MNELAVAPGFINMLSWATEPLLVEVVRNGKLLGPYPSSQEVRARVLEALKKPPVAGGAGG
ncbi:MAG: hypothetical protein HYR98_04675 [Nitrospirae bacterium]|nr:hypothetical protein [Nitrospirota bacterium]